MVHLSCRIALVVTVTVVAGCASYPRTDQLTERYNLRNGYRFEQLPNTTGTNSEELFVVLALSGGGTRAAALSYGVLAQLAKVRLPINGSERSLLDEVDVISSVSGGSFTAAYYALNREKIFDPASAFHTRFLYHPVQRDLLSQAFYYPRNWKHLQSRVEIAARYYADHVFEGATFADLKRQGRPYVIMNSTDASTGARFEFSQEQFDLLCADLDTFAVARAAAASSAFPGLLNSMTIDSYNDIPGPDGAKGCGYVEPTWVIGALARPDLTPRFRAARQLQEYREPTREHLHVLDGGLADNIGLRSVLQSLSSTDRPDSGEEVDDAPAGGWSLLSLINRKRVKTVVIVTVNARARDRPEWDRKAKGPGTAAVLGASAGIPMGNYSNETLELLRSYGLYGDANLNSEDRPRLFGVEVTFEDIADRGERQYFSEIGTNFDLTRKEVDCLVDRGARLLRDSASMTDRLEGSQRPQSFQDFVRLHLGGTMSDPVVTPPGACSVAANDAGPVKPHYLDVGAQFEYAWGASDDVADRGGAGLAVRLARPDGFGLGLAYNRMAFRIPGRVIGASSRLGGVTLNAVTAGGLYTKHLGPLEASAELHAGYGVGGANLRDEAFRSLSLSGSRVIEGGTVHSWVVMPGASLWYRLNNRWSATASTMYTMTRPTLRFGDGSGLADRKLAIRTFSASIGLGFKIF